MLVDTAFLLSLLPAIATATDCPTWSSEFAPIGASDEVHALALYDDGTGEALYVAGQFGAVAGAVSPGVARWDGSEWSDVGGGLELGANEEVIELSALQLQNADVLVAVGSFATVGGEPGGGVAVWDGSQWQRLADGPPVDGLEQATLRTVAAFDSAMGTQLWVGGFTTHPHSFGSRPYLAYWDGQVWTRVVDGPGPPSCGSSCEYHSIDALETFDDGNGSVLYAGGAFDEIDGAPGSTLASFDGIEWSQVPGFGPGGITGSVRRMTVHDDGTGAKLHLLGSFPNGPDDTLLTYDGQTIAGLGNGPGALHRSMASLPPAAGAPASLWLSPLRPSTQTGELEMRRWDGTQWHAVNVACGYPFDVNAIDAFRGGLFVGGKFPRPVGGVRTANVARYDGGAWRGVGSTNGHGLGTQFSGDSFVATAIVHDDGGGAELYAGGEIAWANGSPLTNVVHWDGAGWTAIPGLVLPYLTHVEELLSVDLGDGPELWMAGDIKVQNTNPGAFARWDGNTLTPYMISSEGAALEVYDDGNGPNLYLARTTGLSRYDGQSFTYLGSGQIRAMTVHDDGSGAKLYVAGSFATFPSSGGVAANNVVRWDGASWEPVGDGLLGPGGSAFTGTVHTLLSVDDGTGPELFAGGLFTESGSTSLSRLAAWDGTTWRDVGGGVAGAGARVLSLAMFDDGRGDGAVLYVGGEFTDVGGGQSAQGLARWSGSAWDTAGLAVRGPRPVVRELTAVDLAVFGGRALVVGGDFDGLDATPAQRLSVLRPCAPFRTAVQVP